MTNLIPRKFQFVILKVNFKSVMVYYTSNEPLN